MQERNMHRFVKVIIVCLLALCLTGCSQAANPLLRNEATPMPGTDVQLHSATAGDGRVDQHQATLYFRFLDSDMLAGESRVIEVSQDESLEMALLSALLDGPSAGQIELQRLLGDDVRIEDVSVSGDMLFLTLSGAFLRDSIPANWQSQPQWAQEAPLRRKLALQSIVATVTENLPYTSVQVLVADNGQSSARLDRSYLLTGEIGPADPLIRQESLLLTPASVADRLMNAWQSRDFSGIYALTASYSMERPVYETFTAELDAAPTLTEFACSSGSVSGDGQSATVTLQFSTVEGDLTLSTAGYPLHLRRDNGLWKIPFDTIKQLMLP